MKNIDLKHVVAV